MRQNDSGQRNVVGFQRAVQGSVTQWKISVSLDFSPGRYVETAGRFLMTQMTSSGAGALGNVQLSRFDTALVLQSSHLTVIG